MQKEVIEVMMTLLALSDEEFQAAKRISNFLQLAIEIAEQKRRIAS